MPTAYTELGIDYLRIYSGTDKLTTGDNTMLDFQHTLARSGEAKGHAMNPYRETPDPQPGEFVLWRPDGKQLRCG